MWLKIIIGVLVVFTIIAIIGVICAWYQFDQQWQKKMRKRWKQIENDKKANRRYMQGMGELAELDKDRAKGILPHKDFWKHMIK